MGKALSTAALIVLGLLCCFVPASAQYMYLDANGNGVHDGEDMLNPNGVPTLVDVYVITNQNRDGSTAVCNTDPSVPLGIGSYVVTLEVSGGTVTYSHFVNRMGSTHFTELNPDNIHYQNGYGGSLLAAGVYRVCSLTITGLSGSPQVRIVDGLTGSYEVTSFGTPCGGSGFDNTYRLDGPFTRASIGTAGDWVDTDGLAVTSGTPFLLQVSDMSVTEGETATPALFASDPDGYPVTFEKVTGPPYMTVSTLDPGSGSAVGEISLNPGFTDAGSGVSDSVQATDGISTGNLRTFSITVLNVVHPPTLDPPSAMTVMEGETATQILTASDPDTDELLQFFKDDGPGYMNVETLGRTTGAVTLTPGFGDADYTEAMIGVTDGFASDFKPITITVLDADARPLLAAVDLDPDVVNLGNHAPWLTAYIEPSGFDPVSIDIATVLLAGAVPALPKPIALGDHNGNGVPDLMVKFSRVTLDPLLVPGENSLELTGSLATGESFEGRDSIRAIQPPNAPLSASVAPNPLNPEGILSFHTSKAGRAKVTLLDIQGRAVRMLLDVPTLPTGLHVVPIDGRNEGGESLASGVYFFRVEANDEIATGRIAVLK